MNEAPGIGISSDQREFSWASPALNRAFFELFSSGNADEAFQRILMKQWSGITLDTACSTTRNEKLLHHHFLSYHRDRLFLGIPHSLMNTVIRNIFLFENIEESDAFDETLSQIFEPLRLKLNFKASCLTTVGKITAQDICTVFYELCDIGWAKTCVSRLTQILLWFLHDYEVCAVLKILYENDYFPDNRPRVLEVLSLNSEVALTAKIEEIAQDMLDNFLVGYINPCYYPHIFSRFVAGGLTEVVKIVVATILVHSDLMQTGNNSSVEEFKKSVRLCCDYPAILAKVSTIRTDLDDDTSSSNPEFSTKSGAPLPLSNSTIYSVFTEQIALFPLGCAIRPRLLTCLTCSAGPVFLLIQAEELIGLYLDREPSRCTASLNSSSIFVSRYSERAVTSHTSPYPLRLSLNTHLRLYSNQYFTFSAITFSLPKSHSKLYLTPSNALSFSSPFVYSVSNIELFNVLPSPAFHSST